MHIEQSVMAYQVEQDRLRALFPDGFVSLRPVLRINAEIREDREGYIEYNTAVEKDGNRGWLNIARWDPVPYVKKGKTVTFETDFLELTFIRVGIEGSCPAEKDNAGCYILGEPVRRIPPEIITVNKEFCDCTFHWKFTDADAHGTSTGETLPAFPEKVTKVYPKATCTAENAAHIPCKQVLGTYVVQFER